MTTTVLLIRHGQTEWNMEQRWQGHIDVPLNAAGYAQAQALAARLLGWPLQAIYSSDLQRAAQTAQVLAQAVGLRPLLDPAWRERHVGDFGGLTTPEIKQKYPEMWPQHNGGILNVPNGERYSDLYQRCATAFQQVVQAHPGETVAVVSHGGTLTAVVAYILGIPPTYYPSLSLRGNTGLSIAEASELGQRLILLNDTCHLH